MVIYASKDRSDSIRTPVFVTPCINIDHFRAPICKVQCEITFQKVDLRNCNIVNWVWFINTVFHWFTERRGNKECIFLQVFILNWHVGISPIGNVTWPGLPKHFHIICPLTEYDKKSYKRLYSHGTCSLPGATAWIVHTGVHVGFTSYQWPGLQYSSKVT